MNKRLETAARTLFSLSASSDAYKRRTLDECRADAAVVLVSIDHVMLSPDNVTNAIIDAGYEPAEYMEQFLNIVQALNNQEEENSRFFAPDMDKAWAKGHEQGFWDARQSDAVKPASVTPTASRNFFTEADIKNAEAQGYVSGWENGVLSNSALPDDPSQMPLLGAEHEEANNPYSAENLAKENLREGKKGHAMWCAGNHEGECQRGRVTGTEAGSDND